VQWLTPLPRGKRVALGLSLAEDRDMQRYTLCALVLVALAGSARADDPLGGLRSKIDDKVKSSATGAVVDKINAKLLEEGRKNQCTFKTDSDVLEPGCDEKAKRLANLLIDMKKQLAASNVKGYHFVVSGHTDSTGKADHNVELSKKRAAAITKQLVARGVPGDDILSVGMGSQKMLVKPDDTPAKKAKNRRYEIQVQP
jgi:outer membrane protein OmpA-like peptidoglycan-associated protein